MVGAGAAAAATINAAVAITLEKFIWGYVVKIQNSVGLNSLSPRKRRTSAEALLCVIEAH